MPAGVYRLMFKDPEFGKLDPSELEIGAYTTDTVKIIGSCRFYLVHPDSKKLLDVTFFVATNDGSMLLSSHPAQIKIRLPTTWSQLDHQL